MRSSKASLKKVKLYLILDAQVNSYRKLFDIARESIASGVEILQLRDKVGAARDILAAAHRLAKIAKGKALFIVNDRVDIALLSGADGVHLGQEDLPVDAARKLVPQNFIIGTSCQSLEHVKAAVKSGVDYIGFGSVYKTLTKPDRDPMNLRILEKAVRVSRVPLFAIGGVTIENIHALKAFGIKRFAVCRAICLAKDVSKAVRNFRVSIDND